MPPSPNLRIWPRITTGRLMILVGAIGLIFWMATLAREVSLEKDYHIHAYITSQADGSPSMVVDGAASPPFWPRYWRRLLSRPWKKQPVCGPVEGHVGESCSFARPEMVPPGSSGSVLARMPDLMETYGRLQKDWEGRDKP